MFNRVFISYAKEDYSYAEKLYDFFLNNGLSPWLDKKNLLPGQDWDFYITQELRKADFIVILLSENSISKRGYVQKEFKKALIYCEERLESDIYIIPVKIDNCNPPEKLSKFQWVEFSSTDSFDSILKSIDIQKQLLLESKSAKKASEFGFTYKNHNKIGQYGTSKPRQEYEIEYLKFDEPQSDSLKELNIIIENTVLKSLFWARENHRGIQRIHEANITGEGSAMFYTDSTIYAKINWTRLSTSFISFTNFQSMYSSGAAHGNFGTTGYNFFLNPLERFDFRNLFDDFTKSINILRDLVHERLMQNAQLNNSDGSLFYMFPEKGLEAIWENFNNYYFLNDSIVFVYNPYHITPWVMGPQHPEISFDELLLALPHEKRLVDFIGNLRLDPAF